MDAQLQIYAQYAEHSSAVIAGNRDGLTALRDALNVLLEKPADKGHVSTEVFVSDGEGYSVHLVMRQVSSPFWAKASFPYLAEYCHAAESKRVHPELVIQRGD